MGRGAPRWPPSSPRPPGRRLSSPNGQWLLRSSDSKAAGVQGPWSSSSLAVPPGSRRSPDAIPTRLPLLELPLLTLRAPQPPEACVFSSTFCPEPGTNHLRASLSVFPKERTGHLLQGPEVMSPLGQASRPMLGNRPRIRTPSAVQICSAGAEHRRERVGTNEQKARKSTERRDCHKTSFFARWVVGVGKDFLIFFLLQILKPTPAP